MHDIRIPFVSDAQYRRLQKPMPACHHCPELSEHGYSASDRPTACDPTAETEILRTHPTHACEHGDRTLRRILMAPTGTGTHYPEGSLFMDCQTIPFDNIQALAQQLFLEQYGKPTA